MVAESNAMAAVVIFLATICGRYAMLPPWDGCIESAVILGVPRSCFREGNVKVRQEPRPMMVIWSGMA
jgi:hypothetical protein